MKIPDKPEKFYRPLNPVAQLHLLSEVSFKTLIAGRAFGKSFTNGLEVADKVANFPKSCGLFNSPSYNMILTKTLIPMMSAWKQHCGYIEEIHFVVGKAPPKFYEKPYARPKRYENVVTFWNGTTIIFGSFDRPSTISGGSYDWVITDEAYLIDKDDYDSFVVPAMRPTHSSFKGKPKHLQHSFTSSMPYKGLGDWLLDNRLKALSNPSKYHFIGWQPNAKVQFGSTLMNIEVIGALAIENMLLELSGNPQIAKVMIHNQQVTNWGDTFYPALAPRHWYTPKANDMMISHPLGKAITRNAQHDSGPDDYDPELPINISHDWGAFNCITIDQEHKGEVRFINAMHVHHPKTIDDLADMFAEYYRMHKAKLVYQWGDKSGKNKMPNSQWNLFEQFAERLRDKGWRVMRKKVGDVDQLERHRFITKLHKEEDKRLPKLRHNSRCTDLRIALESAGMKDSHKDKSSERNPAIKPEHATHYTDAYDYRVYHGYAHLEKKQTDFNSYTTSLG